MHTQPSTIYSPVHTLSLSGATAAQASEHSSHPRRTDGACGVAHPHVPRAMPQTPLKPHCPNETPFAGERGGSTAAPAQVSPFNSAAGGLPHSSPAVADATIPMPVPHGGGAARGDSAAPPAQASYFNSVASGSPHSFSAAYDTTVPMPDGRSFEASAPWRSVLETRRACPCPDVTEHFPTGPFDCEREWLKTTVNRHTGDPKFGFGAFRVVLSRSEPDREYEETRWAQSLFSVQSHH